MRRTLFLLLIIVSLNVYSKNIFDEKRCGGKLIYKGTSLQKVIKLCGTPDYLKKVANQYVTYDKVSYKSSGRSRHFMLFKNGYLINSESVMYGASKWAWKLPRATY